MKGSRGASPLQEDAPSSRGVQAGSALRTPYNKLAERGKANGHERRRRADSPPRQRPPTSRTRLRGEIGEGVARKHGLSDHAAEGEHREAAVGELLHLEVLKLGRIGREADRVEAVIARRAA